MRGTPKWALLLPLLVALAGCGHPQDSVDPITHARPQPGRQEQAVGRPAGEITVVETEEAKEHKAIQARAAGLFAAADYPALEELARGYRESKVCYADGGWKLRDVYYGVTPDGKRTEQAWIEQMAALQRWVQARPQSITARVALADGWVDYGWAARGGGYANTVTEQGWKHFGQRLEKAARVLKEAGELKEQCPRSWVVWLTLAKGMGAEKDQFEILFQKAIEAEPAFAPYYNQKAIYLLPRWHGKPGDTADFLQSAADKLGGEEGDVLYARAAWALQGVEGNIFVDRGLTWPRVDKGFTVLEKRYPNSAYVRNGRAYLAVMGSDYKNKPRELVDRLEGKIDLVAWTSKENFLRLTKQFYAP